MATPYWGQLPGPKVVRARRKSEDERRISSDGPPPAAHNRASVQTTFTDAPTDTTFSPSFESPVPSSIAAHGLAPRPPSYQRPPSTTDPNAGSSRRRSRIPRYEDADEQDPTSPSLPNAPEAPSGPPVSYRHPYGNGGLPYTHTVPNVDHHAGQPANWGPGKMEQGEEYIQEPSGHHNIPVQSYGNQLHPEGAEAPRRVSVSGSERRKKSGAIPKSPLQKLELTLDSMTKEEKRARMEAAVRRARARHASNNGTAQPSSLNGNRAPANYNEPRSETFVDPPQPTSTAAPTSRDVHSRRESTVIHRQRPQQQQQPVEPRSSGQHVSQHRGPVQVAPRREQEPELPKRNLSFRERAARDDVALTQDDDDDDDDDDEPYVSAPLPENPKGFGFSLARSGSNKLKKDPPSDPWYRARVEGEQRIAATQGNVGPPGPHHALNPAPRAVNHARRPSMDTGDRGVQQSRFHPEIDSNPQGYLQRRATEPNHAKPQDRHLDNTYQPVNRSNTVRQQPVNRQQHIPAPIPQPIQQEQQLQKAPAVASDPNFVNRESMYPGEGLYKPPVWLEEWQKATVGVLAGPLLDITRDRPPQVDTDKAWWEQSQGTRRRGSSSAPTRPRKAEAFDGEYDGTNAPTRFKPALHIECGPLLRYCGIRRERFTARVGGAVKEKEMWRGSIMIVTKDSDSSYEIGPTLRLFVQDVALLPTPPHQVKGELSPEYVDPIAGHPKLGRRGETLYVRPADLLDEGVDLSLDETDDGLFEETRSTPMDGSPDYPGSFTSRMRRIELDGEKVDKYKDIRGFRLHAEHGYTFWRFNIEVELRPKQQRIAYRINRGPAMAFWVPPADTTMNIMYHSCNGFSDESKADALSGPDPMWRDVLNSHQTKPFHVMVGGGNQIYNDVVADECDLFYEWLEIGDPAQKRTAPFTAPLQHQLEAFYMQRYCRWFSTGLFGLANSQIPMVNMWSDRECFRGFGSYPHKDMSSPVLSGLGAVAFKYYMLFQHQSIIPESETTEPSWILGEKPGPYVHELSRSVYMSLGSKVALLSVDCRTERTENNVMNDKTWQDIHSRVYNEFRRGQVEHLLVVFPVPLAYPRLDWLEHIFSSRAMNPIRRLSRRGLLGKNFNNFESGNEAMDDLRDHWTSKNHMEERKYVVEDLQDLAIDKSVRVTILSGDVNMAAVGQFCSNPKRGLAKHKDPRYMPNVIASSIVNAPPPDIVADALNKRHKVHQFDPKTDESMIPLFSNGVDGKPRNNKRMLPHRNWCSIRQWEPGHTPPPSLRPREASPSPPPPRSGGGIFRRFSLSGSSNRPDMSKESVRGPKPPVSGGGLFHSLSRRLSRSEPREDGQPQQQRPGLLKRTMSLGRGDTQKRGGFFGFGRGGSQRRSDDGGINGYWGPEDEDDDDMSEDDESYQAHPDRLPHHYEQHRPAGLRGGAVHDEFSEGDDSYFTAQPPRRAQTLGSSHTDNDDIPPQALKPFVRTPTGLSVKQMKRAEEFEVDLEGGLDICLNVEVNPRDPTGITVPYRLLVPKLFHEYSAEEDDTEEEEPTGFKKLLSFRKKEKKPLPVDGDDEEEDEEKYSDEEDGDEGDSYDEEPGPYTGRR